MTPESSICLAAITSPPHTFTSLNQELVSLDCTLIRPHLLGLCVFYLLPFSVSRTLAALLILDL